MPLFTRLPLTAALTLAATSGFLAFAGFESAGSLGEESLQPTRMIRSNVIRRRPRGGHVR